MTDTKLGFLDMYFNAKHVHIFEKNNQFYIQGKIRGELQGQPELLLKYIKDNFNK